MQRGNVNVKCCHQILTFWDVTYSLVDRYQTFGRSFASMFTLQWETRFSDTLVHVK
jgi:hypothetical protein